VIVDLFVIIGGLMTVVRWREGGVSLKRQIGARDADLVRYQVAALITGVLLIVAGIIDMVQAAR
jgi:hypothetical protein